MCIDFGRVRHGLAGSVRQRDRRPLGLRGHFRHCHTHVPGPHVRRGELVAITGSNKSSGVINAARTHALAADRLHTLTPSECRCAVPKHRDHPCIALALPQRKLSIHVRLYGIWSGDIDALNSCGNRIAYRACPGLCQNPPFEGIRKPGQTVYFNFEGNRHVAV